MNLAQQPRQIGHSNRLQIGDRFNDFAAQHLIGVRRAQSLKLAFHRIPFHRTAEKAFVVPLLLRQYSAIIERDRDAAWHLIWEPPAVFGQWPRADFAKQRLDVRTLDSFRAILFGHDPVIENGDRYDVWQAVISLLLCPNDVLVAFDATADDVIGHVEGLDIDPRHLGGDEAMLLFKLQDALDGRLRVNFGVVFFDYRSRHAFQVFARPIDLEGPGDGLHKSLVSLEDFRRPGHASHREESGVNAAERGVGVGQPFPVGRRAGAGDAQGVECRSADGDRVGGLYFIQTESF